MQTGYFRVRYLRRGYGAGLASMIVPADSAEVARAIVIGSGVAVPGTVREAEPADTVDTMLARVQRGRLPGRGVASMTRATSNLWALVANDPTHPAVRALCEAVSGMLDVAEVGASLDAGLFEGGARGLAVGRAWPRIGPALRAAAERLGWRPLAGGTVSPDSKPGLD